MKLEFSWQIFENIQLSNFKKIRPLAVELLHADGRTDMTKQSVAFRDFTTRLQIILRPRKEITSFGPRIYSYVPLSLHCTLLYILQFFSSSVFMNIDKGNQRDCSLAEALWARWHNRGS
jgi:hypothetical protein